MKLMGYILLQPYCYRIFK